MINIGSWFSIVSNFRGLQFSIVIVIKPMNLLLIMYSTATQESLVVKKNLNNYITKTIPNSCISLSTLFFHGVTMRIRRKL